MPIRIFRNQFNVSISAYLGFNGQMVLKYVIVVDRAMQPLQKGAMRVNGASYGAFVVSSITVLALKAMSTSTKAGETFNNYSVVFFVLLCVLCDLH